MNETAAARESTPFPPVNAGEPAPAANDPLAGDWAEGLRAPLRENNLSKPARMGVQAAPIPATTTLLAAGAGTAEAAAAQQTEQLDLRSLEGLRTTEPVREPASEVEAPEAWASAEEDQLASVPPPLRTEPLEDAGHEPGKEEVLLLSEELADEDASPVGASAADATGAHAEAPPAHEAQAPAEVAAAQESASAALVESAESPSTDRGGDPPDASQLQAVLAEALGDAAVPHAHDAAQAESVLPAETQAPDEKIEPLAAAFAHVEAVHDETAHNEAAHVEAALGDATAHALAGAPYGGAAQDEIHELIEALEPHDAGAWDSIAAPLQEAAHESAAATARAGAGAENALHIDAALHTDTAPQAEKALHIEDLVPAEVIGADPWGSAFEEAIAPVASAAPEAAPEAPWGAEPEGDNIDWAPAWGDAKEPAQAATPAAALWSEPVHAAPELATQPALATQEEWNDTAAWDAQTAHAASLPAIRAHAGKADEWSQPEPEADWPSAPPSSNSSAQEMPGDDSPFAPLAPGASLSGDDELGMAGEEDGLVELNPADLEPLPPEEHETLFPLEDIEGAGKLAPATAGEPLAGHPLALSGEHRVAVQTRGGQTRRGLLRNADLTATHLTLHASSGGAEPERIASNDVKAVFFMLAPGERGHRGDGARVTITFIDGRTLEGERDGIDAREGFFIVPADAVRTNTRRIYVSRSALLEIVDG